MALLSACQFPRTSQAGPQSAVCAPAVRVAIGFEQFPHFGTTGWGWQLLLIDSATEDTIAAKLTPNAKQTAMLADLAFRKSVVVGPLQQVMKEWIRVAVDSESIVGNVQLTATVIPDSMTIVVVGKNGVMANRTFSWFDRQYGTEQTGSTSDSGAMTIYGFKDSKLRIDDQAYTSEPFDFSRHSITTVPVFGTDPPARFPSRSDGVTSLHVLVTDPSGVALQGAIVFAKATNGRAASSPLVTDSAGRVYFALDSGQYFVSVSFVGMKRANATVRVGERQLDTLAIRLVPADIDYPRMEPPFGVVASSAVPIVARVGSSPQNWSAYDAALAAPDYALPAKLPEGMLYIRAECGTRRSHAKRHHFGQRPDTIEF